MIFGTTTADTRTRETEATVPEASVAPTTAPRTPETRAAEALATRREPDEQRAAAEVPPTSPVPGDRASGLEAPRRQTARHADPSAALFPVPRAAQDIVLLLTRLVVGVVFIAHGLQKLTQGVSGTAEGFGQMGIPLPELSAVFAMVAETGGGALLILGLLTPLAGLLPAVVMAGAAAVHAGNGIFASDGGWELTGALGIGALLLAAVGPGRISLDSLIARSRRGR